MIYNNKEISKNEFAEMHHNKIKKLGYWKTKRETGTLFMLMITEITKLFDEDKLNKPEKLSDLALRIYDYCGYTMIDLNQLPKVTQYSLWFMTSRLTNEMEAFRVGFNTNGSYIRELLSSCYLYALKNNINLDNEILRKFTKLDFVLIKYI